MLFMHVFVRLSNVCLHATCNLNFLISYPNGSSSGLANQFYSIKTIRVLCLIKCNMSWWRCTVLLWSVKNKTHMSSLETNYIQNSVQFIYFLRKNITFMKIWEHVHWEHCYVEPWYPGRFTPTRWRFGGDWKAVHFRKVQVHPPIVCVTLPARRR